MAASTVDSLQSPEPPVPGSSPKLPRAAIDGIQRNEKTGIPLNTAWTFWLDNKNNVFVHIWDIPRKMENDATKWDHEMNRV